MANEASFSSWLRLENPIDMIVANGTGIEKGTLLRLYNSGTVIASPTGSGYVFGGICGREKIASDGRTSIPAYQRGVFILTMATGSSCQAGDLLILSGANTVARASEYASGFAAAMQSGLIVGKALGTASSAAPVPVLVGGF